MLTWSTNHLRDFHSFLRECDGFVGASSAAFDQESLEAMRVWLGETNRSVYALGPIVPPGYVTGLSDIAKQNEVASSNNGGEFESFLDDMLKGHGKHSVIYVPHAHTRILVEC